MKINHFPVCKLLNNESITYLWVSLWLQILDTLQTSMGVFAVFYSIEKYSTSLKAWNMTPWNPMKTHIYPSPEWELHSG